MARRRPTPPDPTTPRPGRSKPYAWPRSDRRGVEGVKWQVLVGHRLRQWRLEPRSATGEPKPEQVQKQPAWQLGLTRWAIMRIELGRTPLDVATLRALATLYGRGPKEIGELFELPRPYEWPTVLAARVPDARFREPPTAMPLAPLPDDEKPPSSRRPRRR